MRKTVISFALTALFYALCASAEAQEPAKVPRIGYLAAASLSANPARTEAFRQGLRDLGYVEGKNIFIEWRYAEGQFDRLPDLAAELVRLKADVIVAAGGIQAILAAKNATNAIPIVVTGTSDPVADGLVASFARPGGTITGLSLGGPELYENHWSFSRRRFPKSPV
jgi:putative ABC transport system substrate-binding protein